MADAGLTDSELQKFNQNFEILQDGDDGSGNIVKRAIPGDVHPDHLSNDVKRAIGELTDDQVIKLNEISDKFKSHIFLHEHENQPGKIIAMGL